MQTAKSDYVIAPWCECHQEGSATSGAAVSDADLVVKPETQETDRKGKDHLKKEPGVLAESARSAPTSA